MPIPGRLIGRTSIPTLYSLQTNLYCAALVQPQDKDPNGFQEEKRPGSSRQP